MLPHFGQVPNGCTIGVHQSARDASLEIQANGQAEPGPGHVMDKRERYDLRKEAEMGDHLLSCNKNKNKIFSRNIFFYKK